MTNTQHWTSRNTDKFAYAIASDFVAQLETTLEDEQMEQKELARLAGVSPAMVSQVLNNPGNLGVKTMAKLALALGLKVAIVTYKDGDPTNDNGPINAGVFVKAWEQCGKPEDLFMFDSPAAKTSQTEPFEHIFPKALLNSFRGPFAIQHQDLKPTTYVYQIPQAIGTEDEYVKDTAGQLAQALRASPVDADRRAA